MKKNITPEIEREIRELCRQGVTGKPTDSVRAGKLCRLYPKDYDRIHAEVKKQEFEAERERWNINGK